MIKWAESTNGPSVSVGILESLTCPIHDSLSDGLSCHSALILHSLFQPHFYLTQKKASGLSGHFISPTIDIRGRLYKWEKKQISSSEEASPVPQWCMGCSGNSHACSLSPSVFSVRLLSTVPLWFASFPETSQLQPSSIHLVNSCLI